MLIKAHVIPEWMYKSLYDEDHKLFSFSNTEHPSKAKRIPKGDYDKDILCSKCDGQMGVFEHYASTVFNGGPLITYNTSTVKGRIIHELSGFDYTKFKLFGLSLLWKASISKRETYKHLKLDPSEEQTIKKMIIENDPGPSSSYPLMIWAMRSEDGKVLRELILSPYSSSGSHIFFIAGYLFVFGSIGKNITQEEYSLSQNGSIKIPAFSTAEAYEILKKMYGINWLT